jgi:hypothetical protein
LSPARQKASEAVTRKWASLTSLHVEEKVNKAENGADTIHAALIGPFAKPHAKTSCFLLDNFYRCAFFFYFNKLRTKPYCLYFPVRLPQILSTSREASLFLPIASLAYTCYLTRPHRDRP